MIVSNDDTNILKIKTNSVHSTRQTEYTKPARSLIIERKKTLIPVAANTKLKSVNHCRNRGLGDTRGQNAATITCSENLLAMVNVNPHDSSHPYIENSFLLDSMNAAT